MFFTHLKIAFRNLWQDRLYAFEYKFLDTEVEQLYFGEQRLVRVILFFTMLAILISCLGLIGLTAFSAEQRVREIGFHKVLGATASVLIWLLTRDLLKLIGLAILIGVPFVQGIRAARQNPLGAIRES